MNYAFRLLLESVQKVLIIHQKIITYANFERERERGDRVYVCVAQWQDQRFLFYNFMSELQRNLLYTFVDKY